jgi:type 1 glutamine amidotransferase
VFDPAPLRYRQHMSTLRWIFCGLLSFVAFGCQSHAAPQKLRVLIIDGQNNHNWEATTAATKATLLKSGRFTVDVSTSPADKSATVAWEEWKPKFSDYDVVLSNFNDGGKCTWAESTRTSLLDFIRAGGGFVVIHAADNSSTDWTEYNRLIGVGGWGGRTPRHGFHMRRTEGVWKKDPAPDGASGSHGPQLEFLVEADAPEHPILAGMPAKWRHGQDELYDSLRGPCEELTVLASAHCPRTNRQEPVLMEIGYGKGRVIHNTMGHVGGDSSVHCVGFQAVLARSAEFAATGEVTLPVPQGFPTPDKASLVAPAEVIWAE